MPGTTQDFSRGADKFVACWRALPAPTGTAGALLLERQPQIPYFLPKKHRFPGKTSNTMHCVSDTHAGVSNTITIVHDTHAIVWDTIAGV
jgi:hypothetical protein